jgi:hypothetical protein
MSFIAPERETIISLNDEDDTADIWTAQRPWITALRRNPQATLIEEGKHGSSVWARFEVPKDLIAKPRSKRRRVSLSPDQQRERAERLKAARAA